MRGSCDVAGFLIFLLAQRAVPHMLAARTGTAAQVARVASQFHSILIE
jgi:hypothetical protein